MFKLRFCLTEDIDEMKNASVSELENDFPFAGYFELNVGTNSFGHWKSEDGTIYGPDLVNFWFTRLMNVVMYLLENDDTEILLFNLYSSWIGFELKNNLLRISSVNMEADNVEMDNFITSMADKQYETEWVTDFIPFDDVIVEVVAKAKEYLHVLENINPLFEETDIFKYLQNQITLVERY